VGGGEERRAAIDFTLNISYTDHKMRAHPVVQHPCPFNLTWVCPYGNIEIDFITIIHTILESHDILLTITVIIIGKTG
jgi:hypothetical protein